jgi:DNA-binding CsgD family transcriptional regulator
LQWTLDLLLLGLGRKEIADQIGISEGTVSGYIRGLYQHFGVNSQAELMRLRL